MIQVGDNEISREEDAEICVANGSEGDETRYQSW
jgi:hypothetical protein